MRPPFVRFAVLAAALAAPAAFAQDAADPAEILGSWSFEAAPTYPNCGLRGEATILPGPEPSVFECRIVATDVCPGVWSYTAQQTCTATRKGDQLVIESRIVSVDPATDRYLPDNFILRIVDGSLMVGELRSAVDANARFHRGVGPIS